ncbi:MAG: sigma-70 family RNA polymerase sigma factor [Planctomycetota bacterium]
MEVGSQSEGFAGELAQLAGRIELLVAHLAGSALRRRIGVEDLAQDVTVAVLASERAQGLRGDELWRFVRAVARSTVVDAARRLRHAPRREASLASGRPSGVASSASSGDGRLDPGAPGPGPRSLVANAEAERNLLAAFDALIPEHRRVLGLRRIEGLSAREAAERMGRSESAIHSLYRRALSAWAEAARLATDT